MEVMPHAFLLRLDIELVVLVRFDLDRHVLHDLQAEALQTDTLHRVVGHQTHLRDTQFTEDLRTHTIITLVRLESEVDIRIHRVIALLLKLIGTYFVHQTDATALLVHVDKDTLTLLFDSLHRHLQLLAALAAEGSEDIARGA